MSTETLEQQWTIEAEDSNWASEAVVNRETGIVSNVLLCGNVSKNGYDIPPSAFGSNESEARALYEGKSVFIDHVAQENLNRPYERSVKELAGVIERVRYVNGKPRADIDTKGCHEAKTFLDLAEAKKTNVGMSHVAHYQFDESQTTVEKIHEVATVDVVVFPATTRSFSENTHGENSMTNENVDPYKEQIVSLKQEKTTISSERDTLKTDIRTTKEALEKATAESDKLKADFEKLTSERDDLKKKVDEFEAEKAVGVRRQRIAESCKTHGLNTEDKDLCSDTFMEMLLEQTDDTKRDTLIKERASVIDKASKGGTTFQGTQERSSSGNGDTFNAEDEWKQMQKV